MENQTILQRYIDKCDDILHIGDENKAHLLIGEIISIFASSIDGLKSGLDSYAPGTFATFGGVTSCPAPPDYIADIRKLKGKLEVEMEKDVYGRTQSESEKEVIAHMVNKPYKIFISHSSKDKPYVEKIVEFLEDIGLGESQIFCSSVHGYGIPLSENIYDFLRSQFEDNNLHVIFVLSENYYQSVASLNEMGAAWVLRNKYTSILLPGFNYSEIDGAIDPRDIALKLDSDEDEVNQRLLELCEMLSDEFHFNRIALPKWERIRSRFKDAINAVTEEASGDDIPSKISEHSVKSRIIDGTELSGDAQILLAYAGTDDIGKVIISKTLSGTFVSTGGRNFVGEGSPREQARWLAAVEELEKCKLIKADTYKRDMFSLSYKAFHISDKIRKTIEFPEHKSNG